VEAASGTCNFNAAMANYWNWLRGSTVVARRPFIVIGKNFKVFGDGNAFAGFAEQVIDLAHFSNSLNHLKRPAF
jgi:hypothetical protein